MGDRFPEPVEAEKFLSRKVKVETEKWDELKWGEHAHAFTVAHSIKAGVLDHIHGLLNKAMSEGQAFSAFKKNMLTLMEKSGWYGREGKTKDDKTYINWRIRIIYDTNMRTAHAAARYRRQLQAADLRPVWIYKSKLVGKNRRQEHIVLHNKAFRYDDPFWNSYYPPNGWECKCFVDTRSESGAQREKIDILETDKNGNPPDIGVDWNTVADKAWKYNVGCEALAPNFGKFNNIKDADKKNGTHYMEEIRNRYQEDLDKSRMTEPEFSAYMRRAKDTDYRSAGYILQVGNLENKRFVALSGKTGITDSKIMATDTQLWHSQGNKIKRVKEAENRTDLTPAEKVQEVKRLEDMVVPQDMFGDLYEQLQEPDRIYLSKNPHTKRQALEFHFVKTLPKGRVIRIVLRVYMDPENGLYLAPEVITIEKIDDVYKGKGLKKYEEIKW
ncbi:MAG: phage head morphogenesis protein [Spirochaetaceae bacterium]|jgi:uncharacterized protein with gpF-like domain|nr:phage head morphogenesis protein [Spirochaetaceae bacterium]